MAQVLWRIVSGTAVPPLLRERRESARIHVCQKVTIDYIFMRCAIDNSALVFRSVRPSAARQASGRPVSRGAGASANGLRNERFAFAAGVGRDARRVFFFALCYFYWLRTLGCRE